MPLSRSQCRALAEIERDLSADPALVALSELFTEPLVTDSTPPEPAAGPRRSILVIAVLALSGIAGSITAGALGLAAVACLGTAVALGLLGVALAIALRGIALRRHSRGTPSAARETPLRISGRKEQ